MKCSFTPYAGDKPYIFVSYSHKDSDRVYPILEYLNSQGFRIWYDDGIRFGYDWRDDIADHIEQCAVFMVFPTADYVASTNCQKEIKYALSNDVTVVPAYLDDVELSSGMKMELSYYQALYAYQYPTMTDFLTRLSRESILQICKGVVENISSSHNLDVNNLPDDVKLIIPQDRTVLRKNDLKDTEGFKKIYIPDSVTHIEAIGMPETAGIEEIYGMKCVIDLFFDNRHSCVFSWWENLTGIYIDDENPMYKSVNGILFNKMGDILVFYPNGRKDDTYILPDDVSGIVSGAFDEAKFENIEISRSFVGFKEIDENELSKECFRYEFVNIVNLKNIIVDANNENYSSIDGVMFNKAGDKLMVYPHNKTESVYVLPRNVKSIADGAFSESIFREVKISDSVTVIGDGAFGFCCYLKNIVIPNSVTSIGAGAFSGCGSLESVTIPDSVDDLGVATFLKCEHLKSITLPKRFQSQCEKLGLGPDVEKIFV